jgi:hypothetical protein
MEEVERAIQRMADHAEAQARFLRALDQDELQIGEWLDVLARLGMEQSAIHALANTVSSGIGLPKSARSRILAYFRRHVGEVVSQHQLACVGGIHEWARRVRELRKAGWPIVSDQEDPELKPGQYRMTSPRRGEVVEAEQAGPTPPAG